MSYNKNIDLLDMRTAMYCLDPYDQFNQNRTERYGNNSNGNGGRSGWNDDEEDADS